MHRAPVVDRRPPLLPVPVEAPLRDPAHRADDVHVVREREHHDLPVIGRPPQLDVRTLGDGLHGSEGTAARTRGGYGTKSGHIRHEALPRRDWPVSQFSRYGPGHDDRSRHSEHAHPDRRTAAVRRGDPRLQRARGGDARAARRAHQRGHRAAQPGPLQAVRSARLRRRGDPGGLRRLRRRARRPVPAARRVHQGPAADRRDERQPDRRGRLRALRHRGAEAGHARRDRPRRGHGDRDERAGGRVRRRRAQVQGGPRGRRLPHHRPQDLDQRRARRRADPADLPHRRERLQARGHHDARGAGEREGRRDPRHPDDGRQGGQRRLVRRRRRPRREPARRGGQRLDAAHGRPQRRAPDHRREHARARPSARSTTCSRT